MTKLTFGWHMPSFPVDGSDAQAFVQQITQTMDLLQPAFDSAWVDDHFWPWAKFQAPDTPYMECFTTITWFAARYPTLRFASCVACQSYRTPGMLAKMVANLQLLTGGRFIFGLGAGWMEDEYHGYHYDFPKPAVRIAQLEETIQLIQALWQNNPATYAGQYYAITNAYLTPKPDPIPPLLIGGGGEQLTLKVVAKYADWWNLSGGTLDNFAHKLDVLRQHCTTIGRNYDEIVKTWDAGGIAVAETEAEAQRIADASPFKNSPIVGTPAQVAAQLQRFADIGITYFIVKFLDFPATNGIELFIKEVLPLLQK